jgi:hypothetical protein
MSANPITARYSGRMPFSINERDLDLLIVEQLHTSQLFVKWLTDELGLTGARFDRALHSVVAEHGETDVLVFFKMGSKRVAVMIEDKIGAAFQPQQAERYHLRGQALCSTGQADHYMSVLCAPSAYLRGVGDAWTQHLAVEKIAEFFHHTKEFGWEWRAAMLQAAAGKSGRARAVDEAPKSQVFTFLAGFKSDYAQIVNSLYPQFYASTQTGRDREYYLSAPSLPKGIRLKHAFFKGQVSLIFEKQWAELAARLILNLPEAADFQKFGAETHIRLPTEVLDPDLPLAQQTDVVQQAMTQLDVLLALALTVARSA